MCFILQNSLHTFVKDVSKAVPLQVQREVDTEVMLNIKTENMRHSTTELHKCVT